MNYTLPKSIEINGVDYEIRSDYRAVLDICTALSDADLSDEEKAIVAIDIFYVDEIPFEDMHEAIKKCYEFISQGEDEDIPTGPKLVDWEQDFNIIIAPINRVAGKEIRDVDYMHWWTFVSLFNEIGGDCLFAQVVSIRDKLARGKSLDKTEKEFLRANRRLIDFKRKYTEADEETLKGWI